MGGVSDEIQQRAEELRAMGIGHELITTDEDLVEMVDLLSDLGVPLEDMVNEDLTFLGAPRMIRPDATIEPGSVFKNASDADFRGRAALALGFNVDEDTRLLTQAEGETVEFDKTEGAKGPAAENVERMGLN